MNDLKDARILVVGGSSGIGLATTRAALTQGARVTIASRSAEHLAQAAESVSGAFETLELDVSSDDAVTAAMRASGAWDHVAITAGGGGPQGRPGQPSGVRDVALDAAGLAFNTKFWGAYRIAATADIRPGGSITFVSGVYSYRPERGRAMAAVSGAALEQLARVLALEIAPSRANVIVPGLVDTPMWDRLPPGGKDKLFAQIAASAPVGRAAKAEEIAAMIVLCMTNPMVTGATLICDGGHTLT